ncbi:MAG: HlyD family efflux transporter periplasmic adaptor subunit, partial [Methylocystis sp.]
AALAAAQTRPDHRPAAMRRVGALQDALGRDERITAAAQQELDAAKARLDDARIVAPTDGVVLARNVEPGQAVAANSQQPLFLFAPGAAVEFKAFLPDSLAALKPGDRVVFTVDALRGESFDGEILSVTPAQGGEGGQVVVRAKNPSAALKLGMKATIRMPASN